MKTITLTQIETDNKNRVVFSDGGIYFLVYEENDQFLIKFFNKNDEVLASIKTCIGGDDEADTQLLKDTQFFLRYDDIVESIVKDFLVETLVELDSSVVDLDCMAEHINDVMQEYADEWIGRVKASLQA